MKRNIAGNRGRIIDAMNKGSSVCAGYAGETNDPKKMSASGSTAHTTCLEV